MLQDESKLLCEQFQELIKDDKELNYASEYIFSELIDDLILRIVFDQHYNLKREDNADKEEEEMDEDDFLENELKQQKTDTMNRKKKKVIYCKCSNCQKVVAVQKFASHLEHCMGIGRKVRLRKRKEPGQ